MIWTDKTTKAVNRIAEDLFKACRDKQTLPEYRTKLAELGWPTDSGQVRGDPIAILVQRVIAGYVWKRICRLRVEETEKVLEDNHNAQIATGGQG
jgi:hypothetical protein